MDPWSSSSAYYESDQLQRSTPFERNDFTQSYDLGIPPSINTTKLQDQRLSSYLDNMSNFDVKLEPDWEEGVGSSSTPSSDHTRHPGTIPAEPAAAASTRLLSTKKRRDTESSTESAAAGASSSLSREKNRLAASKCRRKKKVEEKKLEERRRMLQVQNAILNDSAVALRDEVLALKNEILLHGSCDFPPIQTYIKTAASQVN